jgi:hypothetical protein
VLSRTGLNSSLGAGVAKAEVAKTLIQRKERNREDNLSMLGKKLRLKKPGEKSTIVYLRDLFSFFFVF